MKRFRKIMLATDFSDCADHAKDYAFAFAKSYSATLHIAHAVDTSYSSYVGVFGFGAAVDLHIDEIQDHARTQLMQLVEEAKSHGIEAQPFLLDGRPADETVDLARKSGCDLLVVGTHGRSGFDKFLFGSTCDRMVRLSPVPVLTVKDPSHDFITKTDTIELNRVLCPCDFSEHSQEALPLAADLCRAFDATMVLAHVVDSRVEYPVLSPIMELPTNAEFYDKAVKLLEEIESDYKDVSTQLEVVTGIPHAEIAKSTKSDNIDLVVLSTHGRSGLAHALLGGTAEKVVRSAHCPVLTVRPEASVEVRDTVKVQATDGQPASA